jgi:hypothetical protein
MLRFLKKVRKAPRTYEQGFGLKKNIASDRDQNFYLVRIRIRIRFQIQVLDDQIMKVITIISIQFAI